MFIIGIDGGGTSTQGALSSGSEVIAKAEVASTNYHNVGKAEAKNRFRQLLDILTKAAAISLDQVDGICLGGAGIDSETDEKMVSLMFRDIGFAGELIIVNDAVTALVGGNASLSGAVIISGTGSIAYGQIDGKTARCGGWGHLIDDGGSGYDLGISALRSIMEASDGREEATQLWPAIKNHLGIDREDDIIHFLYNSETGKEKIAALAPYVIQLADKDKVAHKIVEASIHKLVGMIGGLCKQLGEDAFSLTVAGSVLIKSEAYRNKLKESLDKHYPKVELHLPKAGPVEGALIIMKNHLEKEKSHA